MMTLHSKGIRAAALALILLLAGPSAAPAPAGNSILSVTPDRVDFGVMRNTQTAVRSVEIGGRGRIAWKVKWAEPWLTLNAYSGVVEDDVQVVSVTAHPRDLSLGRHQTELVIATSAGTRTIPVSLTILQGGDAAPGPQLERIILTSPTTAAQVGRKVRLGALGVYSDGSRRDITKGAQWVSDNRTAGDFVEKGFFLGRSAGNVRVFAKEGRVKSPPMTVRVDPLDGPLLKAYLSNVTLDHMEKNATEALSLSLRNAGTGDLEWEAVSRASWLVVERDAPPDGADRTILDERRSWGAGYSGLSGTGAKTIKITVDTTGLPEGTYEGDILIRSNGGDEEIAVPITVLSLASISLTPVSVKMAVNDRMAFRATGIWSDGSRTDLSSGSGGRWVLSDPSVGFFLRRRPVFIAGTAGRVEIRRVKGNVSSNAAIIDVDEAPAVPVLLVSSHEVDFGTIGPGEISKGDVFLKNVGGGELVWDAHGMEGWSTPEGVTLSGTAGRSGRRLRLSVESVAEDETYMSGPFAVRMRLDAGHSSMFYEKFLSPGIYREELKLHFNGGERSLFLTFAVAGQGSRPSMEVYPLGIDLGSLAAGEAAVKKIELRNVGKSVLKWNAVLQGNRRAFRGVTLEKGRYISFADQTASGKNRYTIPERLRDRVAISGEWAAGKRGYPSSTGEGTTFRYAFSGSGIAVFLWKDLYGGTVDVFVDGRMVGEVDCAFGERKRIEFPAAENLAEGETHLLVLVARGGAVEIEGVRVYTTSLMEGRKGWIGISPERGTTTNEVDYITVSVAPEGLPVGSYGENIIFYSDEGMEVVEVSLDVTSASPLEFIDIYRYAKGAEILMSPEDEQGELRARGYRKEGPVFRLFRTGTPGTAEFFRWHNASKGTYFYSYNRSGWKRSLRGYVFDGPIGNIATLKLPHTRDLYRWYNPRTEAYFYTTDPKGEDQEKKGYVYDGIAGYVR
ncbi:MAG: hypothetical protein JXI32_04485 [Deltaproteobacteria bacterium]|nr:hypothetical protein [Deltaproteobacteria bacterium]